MFLIKQKMYIQDIKLIKRSEKTEQRDVIIILFPNAEVENKKLINSMFQVASKCLNI